MRWLAVAFVSFLAATSSSSPAFALCSYKGVLYAKTGLSQEFADARWVVRVRVAAADQHWSDEDESWTMYHLKLPTTFKERPPAQIEMFTYRNSGGFYLDRGMDADLGGEYLLFLNPIERGAAVPAAARRATQVNYECGQSRSWQAVSNKQRQHLLKLAQTR